MSYKIEATDFKIGERCAWCLRGKPYEADHGHRKCPLIDNANTFRQRLGWEAISIREDGTVASNRMKKAFDVEKRVKELEKVLEEVQRRLAVLEGGKGKGKEVATPVEPMNPAQKRKASASGAPPGEKKPRNLPEHGFKQQKKSKKGKGKAD